MHYLNEHLFIGKLGILFIILFLICSVFSSYFYYKISFSKNKNIYLNNGFLQKARIFFITHFIAIVFIFICLYIILINHYFEYYYAYQHSNYELPLKYILSCFWEGQEGSFLLWSFWNGFIGLLFIFKFKKWEKEILCIVSLFQFCISSMIIGINIFDIHIGNNPFHLLRQEMINAPIFSQANYLSLIKDGVGLNALLQNYWMVIHPPILFLGFSLFIFPFSFVIIALLKNNYKDILKDILLWTTLSAGILGIGVMMGAAWAYESLTFGGYWAWDPVENASLVPWLILIAALHTNLIYNKTQRYLRLTLILYILSFLFILYSTYLTRSGILGDTSVHSFTDLGIKNQLLLLLFIFVIPSFIIYIKKYKNIPNIKTEENIYSREFVIIIGSAILFLASLIISFKTSLPVFNKIFNTKLASPSDIEFSYNSNQIFVALILCLLSGFGFYFKFKNTPKEHLKKHLKYPIILSLIIGIILIYLIKLEYLKKGFGFNYSILITFLCALFSTFANAYYLIFIVKRKYIKYGGALSHIGFSILIIGILISASKKNVLSWNTTGFSPLKENQTENPLENITLVKGVKTDMGLYNVTYLNNDSINEKTKTNFYQILFENKKTNEKFSLYPDVIQNTKMQEGLTPNPDSKHFITKDIFVYLTYVQDLEKIQKDTSTFKTINLKIGDTFFYSKGLIVLNQVNKHISNKILNKFNLEKSSIGISAEIKVLDKNGSIYIAEPSLTITNNNINYFPDTIASNGLIFNLNKLVSNNKFQFSYKESSQALQFITLKVFEFPYINLVWIGTIIMFFGFILSSIKRYKEK